MKFFPPEDVNSFTSMSEKALLYMPEGFEHKILSMGEAIAGKEVEFQDYLLRELMSENKLRYSSVQKIHGELKTVMIEKNGPVAFMVTTTRNKLNPENETRMLSLEINDSQDQTKQVLDKIAEREGRNRAEQKIDFEPWHDYQRWLAAGDLGSTSRSRVRWPLIPPKAVRLRRDFSQLLRAIKAHALLHRAHREVTTPVSSWPPSRTITGRFGCCWPMSWQRRRGKARQGNFGHREGSRDVAKTRGSGIWSDRPCAWRAFEARSHGGMATSTCRPVGG